MNPPFPAVIGTTPVSPSHRYDEMGSTGTVVESGRAVVM
jgi:hypothetical protein